MTIKQVLKRFVSVVDADNETNRREWIRQQLEAIPPGGRILDAGAGPQQYRRYCSHLRYVSQDFAQYDGEGDGAGLQVKDFNYPRLDIVSDVTAIPEADASFDAILCSEVLEHVPDPIAAIREFSRLLRAGGILIVTAPFASLTHFSPYHFSTGFSRYWYEEHLVSNGLTIGTIEASGSYFSYLAQEVARVPSISQVYARHRLSLPARATLFCVRSLLVRLSVLDRGSSELLCYGYHVVARKQ
jgi:SAM-dependent methyltransferase